MKRICPSHKNVFSFLRFTAGDSGFLRYFSVLSFAHKIKAQRDWLIFKLKNSLLRDILDLNLFADCGRYDMAVSYKKLFHLLIEKDMTNAQLQQEAGFSANIITRLKRNGYISLESVESICHVLQCGVDDILEFIPDGDGGKKNG